MNKFARFLNIIIFGLFASRGNTAIGSGVLSVDGGFSRTSIMKYLELVSISSGDGPSEKFKFSDSRDFRNYIFHNANETIVHRINIENTTKQSLNLVMFSDLALSSFVVKEISENNRTFYAGKRYSSEQSPQSLIPSVAIKMKPGMNTYEIITSMQGNIGPAQLFLWTEKEFFLHDKEMLIYISLVFGAVTSLLLYNIFLLSVNKSWNIFYFTMTCFFLGMVESVISGANSIFSFKIYTLTSRLWPVFTCLSVSFFALYLKEANYASRKMIGNKLFYVIVGIANFVGFSCVILVEYLHYDVQIFSVFFATLATGLVPYLLGKYKIIDHLVFIASLPMVFATFLLVGEVTNFTSIGIDLLRIQLVSAVFFLLCLSIYTGSKTHNNRLEKVRLQEMITLGRNVQDLLLPKRLEGASPDLKYIFAYEPFEGKMSGDWIKYWRTKNGNHQFLLGDVTGKGPQAALAVSIISTIVDRCIRLDNDARTALIQINKTLYSLLKGNMGSTASATTIKHNGDLILYNTAGIGWIVQDQLKKDTHFLGRSGILGQKSFVEISELKVPNASWDFIYTFSDGVCNGPRAVKYLSRHLKTIEPNKIDSKSLRKEVLSVSKSIGDPQDDKTFLIIQSNFRRTA